MTMNETRTKEINHKGKKKVKKEIMNERTRLQQFPVRKD